MIETNDNDELIGQIFGNWTVKARSPNDNTKVICDCSCGETLGKLVTIKYLKNGSSKSCGCYARRKDKPNYYYEIGQEIHNNRFNGIITDRYKEPSRNPNHMIKYYDYDCTKCGFHNTHIVESGIKNGNGCIACYNRAIMIGNNDIPTTDPWMVKFFQGGIDEARQYTRSSHKTIYPICPFCGVVRKCPLKINTIYYNKGFGCQCKDSISIPNKTIYKIMSELFNKGMIRYFEREYLLDNNQPYDTYFEMLNGDKYLVEMDSNMHEYIRIEHRQKFKSFDSLIRDSKKDKMAINNNIPLIRIDCFNTDMEYIKTQIEKSKLGEIFDLSIIDWNVILNFICSNFIKEVCEYKKLNPDYSSFQVAKHFGISASTAMLYMKKGNKLGWCQYDPKEAWYKAHDNIIYYNRYIMTHVIYNDTDYYFKTAKEFAETFKIKYQICINIKKIRELLRVDNHIKDYKGCEIFKINKEEYLNGKTEF